jgi:hypothetical protein
MGGAGEIDKGVVTDLEPGLTAVLFYADLALRNHVDLDKIRLHEVDVTAGTIRATRPGGPQFTNMQGTKGQRHVPDRAARCLHRFGY